MVKQQVNNRQDVRFGTVMLFLGFILQAVQYARPPETSWCAEAYTFDLLLLGIVGVYLGVRKTLIDMTTAKISSTPPDG